MVKLQRRLVRVTEHEGAAVRFFFAWPITRILVKSVLQEPVKKPLHVAFGS
jgi:hypothetical protein